MAQGRGPASNMEGLFHCWYLARQTLICCWNSNRLGSRRFSGAWWLGNQAKLRNQLQNLSPDVFNKLFVPLNALEALWFEPWPATRHSRRISAGPGSQETGPVSSLTLKSLRFFLFFSSLQWECFYLLLPCLIKTTVLIVFLTYCEKDGEREVEHVLGTQIISLNIHGNLLVGYHCFHFRNGEQAWWSSWPSHVVPTPERIWTQVIWLHYTVEFYVEPWEKWQVWFCFPFIL